MDKILIALDDSEFSKRAAAEGFKLAKRLGAHVALVFVIDRALTLGDPDAGYTSHEIMEKLKEEAQETLDKVMHQHPDHDKIYQFTPLGDPEKEIVSMAEEWGAEMIVMGTHGRSGLLHALMGSVAEHVLRKSKVPVLVVPNRD